MIAKVTQIEPPDGSLLAQFGDTGDYRDCFAREVSGEVTLNDLIVRFYTGAGFRVERMALGLIGHSANAQVARALARGEVDEIGVWKQVGRRDAEPPARSEIMLHSRGTGTACMLAVEPLPNAHTRLIFGSWVGDLDRSGWRFMERLHVWYSHLLLGSL